LTKAYESYPQLAQPSNSQNTSKVIKKTSIIEALNLKAAIIFLQDTSSGLNGSEAAIKTIKCIPQVADVDGIDPVTFHN